MITALIILVIAHAWIDAWQIRKGWDIYHGWETLAYLNVAGGLSLWYDWQWVLIFSVVTRAAFFDPLLNLFRGKHFAYNGAGASVIDRIENWTRIPHWIFKVWWIALYTGMLIFYLYDKT